MKKILTVVLLLIIILCMACVTNPGNIIPGKTFTVVCFGDSLTSGHGAVIPRVDDPDKSYPAFLKNRINAEIINAGVAGNTTAQGLSRINEDVLSKNPQLVIVKLSANDLFQGIPLQTTHDNLKEIVSLLNDGNRRIYIAKFYTEPIAREMMNMLQVTGYDAQTAVIDLYNAMFESLVVSDNIILIEDIWAGVWGIHMSDHHHPDERGYEIMADNYFNILKPYLMENNLLR